MTLERERIARLRLARLTEPGDATVAALVEQEGASLLLERIEAGDKSLVNIDNYRARIATPPSEDIERLADVGARFIIPTDLEWPSQLDALQVATPLGLFVRGATLRTAALRSVAVVGSRAATDYGLLTAGDLGHDLGSRGWTVVSGGAVGIDGAAHRGALSARGQTVAVLACGVDVAYPRAHDELFGQIVDCGGTIVSELPPQTHPTKPRFLQRNRIIAGITRGAVVVEAAHRSGALNTAAYCRRLGRQLMAVPGPVTSAMSVGCHRLLRDDDPARLVANADEVIEEVGAIGDLAPQPSAPNTVRDSLDPVTLRVLEAVAAYRPMNVADIAVAAGLAIGVVGGCLLRLSVMGLVEADTSEPSPRYRLVWGVGDLPATGSSVS